MPVPDFQILMLPVLRATADGEITSAALRERVAVEVGISEDDLSERLRSGQTTFANRVAWALVDLQRGGLVEKVARGVYRITDEGLRVLSADPPRIDIRPRKSPPQPEPPTPLTPEEQIEATWKSLKEDLEADLLRRLLADSPAQFERHVVDLLIAMDYGGGREEMGRAIGRGGDGGIDGIIKEDALGLDIVYVQAKRYRSDNIVGRPEVQGFAGSLEGVGASKGIFVTTSSFSAGAREYAERIAKRIILVDGAELARLMVRHGVGVRTRTAYEIKTVDEDYFTE